MPICIHVRLTRVRVRVRVRIGVRVERGYDIIASISAM